MSNPEMSHEKSKHTPGEWTLGHESLTTRTDSGVYRTPVLANKAPDGDMMPAQAFAPTREGSIANGRIISAAPDLLRLARLFDDSVNEAILRDKRDTPAFRARWYIPDGMSVQDWTVAEIKNTLSKALGASQP